MKCKRWIRRIIYTGLGLSLVLAGLAVVLPELARRHLETTLREMIGGPVVIGHVGLSLSRIEVRSFRILDAATSPNPWLNIDRAVFDLPLWQALLGRTKPKTATIDGLVARFELDDSLALANDLSFWQHGFEFPFERIDIQNARVEICPANQPTFALDHIAMTLQGPTEAIRAEGQIGGSLGAAWRVAAKVDGRTLEMACTLTADELPFSTDMLAGLPFAPQDVTDRVRATGVASARITLRHTPGSEFHYRVAASPRSLNILLPRENLAMMDGRCELVLEDGAATLQDFQGRIAGGQLTASGRLDLLGPVWHGQMEGDLSGIALENLPNEWNLPPEIIGVASAKAKLNVNIADSRTVLHGDVEASVDRAELLGSAVKLLQASAELRELAFDDRQELPHVDGLLTVRAEMDQADLPGLLAGLPGLEHDDSRATGRVDMKIGATVPLATLSDRRSYVVTGEFRSPAITWDGTALRNVAARLEVQHGSLSIEPLKATLGETGAIDGAVRIPLVTGGEITSDLRFEGIAIQDLETWLPAKGKPVDGRLSGVLQARAPANEWSDLAAWRVNGNAETPQIRIDEYLASDVAATLALGQGKLQLNDLQARWEGAVLHATGTASVAPPHAYRVEFEASELDVPRLARLMKTELPVTLNGKATIKGNAQGNLKPFDWHGEGSGKLANSTIGAVELDSPSCNWQVTPAEIRLTDARVGLFAGQLDLSAELPLDGRTPSRVEGSFRDLHTARMGVLMPTLPVTMSGAASGDFSLTGFNTPSKMHGTLRFRGLDAEARGASIRQLGGTAEVRQGRVDLELDGRTFGGQLGFRGGGKLPSDVKNASLTGRLALKAVDASKLAQALGQPALTPLRAIMDVDLELTAQGPAFLPKGHGSLVLKDVAWRGNRVTREVRSRAVLTGSSLTVQGISLDLADGTVSGDAALRLDRPGTGSFQVNLRRLRTEQLPVLRDELAGVAEVRLDASFRGQFAPGRVSASGETRLSQGHIAGVPIREVSGPVGWAIDPARGKGEVRMRLSRGDLAGGRVSGSANLKFGRLVGVDGRVKFTGLDLRPIAQAVPALSDRLSGRVTGEASFQDRNIRSLGELSGTYRLSLSDSPVLQLPVLNALAGTNGIVPASQLFSTTEIAGRVYRGSIEIDRMTMMASGVHMFVEGTISKRGQLDLDVTADTGELMAVSVAMGLLRPMDLVRRRLIFLNMGGTARRPVVTPDVDRFVQQEVLLFFFPFVVQ